MMNDVNNVVNKEDREIEIDVIRVVKALLDKMKYIMLIAIIFGLLGYLGSTLLITPVYEANGKMIVITRNPEDKISNDQMNAAKNLVDTYAVIICDWEVLDRVISELNLSMTYQELANSISVKAINNTQIMKITIRHTNRLTALLIAQKILEIVPSVITETVGAGSVNPVGQPHVTANPVYPSDVKNAIVAALAGFALASVVFAAAFLMDNTYKSDMDIQDDLGVIVLGVIPKLECCGRKYGYATKYGYGKYVPESQKQEEQEDEEEQAQEEVAV